MQPTALTIEILKGIRDEVRTLRIDTNARFDETNQRLDETNQRLIETNRGLDRLERRQTEADMRLATELVAVVGAVREVRDLLREDRALEGRIDDHERRIAAIETRAG